MINIIKEKWDEILELMKIEHDISEAAFNTWVKALYVHSVRGSKVYVTIKDELATGIDYVIKKYKIPLQVAMCEVLDCQLDVDIVAPDAIVEMTQDTKPVQAKANLTNTNLNPRYTFETFVVGKNNELAHATALAVAEDPGIYGNPLFIYGGVGLGKTHLMHSIAHYVLSRRPNQHILYVTSEEFTNELITAIRTNRNEEFRNKYRNLDMLLIDDIQFIVGRESTQEEFFHTFNTLYSAKKQIVISSDKPPKDIENLEDRLISRFKVGLTVDIQPPNYETRMAILSKYAELDNIDIDQECMHYVADNIKSNIRELEGALNQIHNLSRLKNKPITMALVREALENIITPDLNKPVTAESIINIVAEHFNISPTDIVGHKRSRDIAYPRQICMYLCRHMTDNSLQAIGNALGKKDHTTIIHGMEKIEKDMKTDESLKNTIDILIKKINPSK
ncbi:MAG TPA: chromosomal replication initiator protein DnaA [Candidatus Scybalocola faecipullorum]|nr:chromosomal replication initiator protein DnaA [Candidatus Scybalocola faecipullorum]